MFRACLIIPIFHLVFIFSGCSSVLEHMDGSSKREIEIFRMSADDKRSEIDRLDKIISEFENKNKYLGIQIEVMKQKTVKMAYEHEQERKSFKKEFGVVLKAQISELELQMSEKEENINLLEEKLAISRNKEELRSINDYLFLQIKRDLYQRDRTIKKLEETIRELKETIRELKEGSHDRVFIGSPRRSVVPEGKNNMPSNIPIPIKED